MNKKKKFSELPPAARLGLVIGAVVQLALLAAAQRDISRRNAAEIRGPRWAWRAASFVNFVGPLSYFVFGRKHAAR